MLIKGIQTQSTTSGEDVVKMTKVKKNEKISLRKKAKAMRHTFDESHGSTDSQIIKSYGFDPYPADLITD